MKAKYLLFFIIALIFSKSNYAQNIGTLKQKIETIIADKKATVGVAISSNIDSLAINGDAHFPLQSVFKYHIAVVVLDAVDKKKFTLNQKIEIKKDALLPGLYSPLRDKYPNGAALPLSTIIEYSVALSDNVGCDVLLKLIGGPKVVEQYFKDKGIQDIAIKYNEETQQGNWELQFQNWTTPNAANKSLKFFYKNGNKLLSKKSYDFLWKTMKACETGINRLPAGLPKKTILAHKTGTSGYNKAGVTEAVHDIGIVFLPNGKYYCITVLVSHSTENIETNEKIIADISKAAWSYFVKK